MDIIKIGVFVVFLIAFFGWLLLTNWITNTRAARALVNELTLAHIGELCSSRKNHSHLYLFQVRTIFC